MEILICHKTNTMEPRYNEPLYHEVLGTIFFTPVIVTYMKKYLDITKLRFSEQGLASPLALRYIEASLYLQSVTEATKKAKGLQVHLI